MALWQSILLGIAALIVIATLIELYVKRNRPRRPLAEQFLGDDVDEDKYDKPELGMEEIDMDLIRESERGNKSAAALGARDQLFWTKRTRRRHSRSIDTPPTRTTGDEK